MPTYDYRCDACGHEFEHFQSMSSSVLRKCPECRKLKLRRLIGAGGGLIFKGSGFYITDYRGDSYAKDKSSDSATTEKSAGKDGEGAAKAGKSGKTENSGGDKPAKTGKDAGKSSGKSSGKSRD